MQPFVKWAGGKRQLLPAIKERMPKNFNYYYEPFIGGGALLLDIKPKNALVGDTNVVLVNTFNYIKTELPALKILLDTYSKEHNAADDKKSFYLKMRNRYNEKISNEKLDLETTAIFMYLNKTCFNGLYRVNSRGLFNVPYNNNKSLKIYDDKNLEEISNYLNNVKVVIADFEETCKTAKEGDFVFFDSPYAPLKDDTFEAYTKEGFSYEEHIRLSKLFKELTEKGVYCMLTNHNTPLINELYKDFNIDVVFARRSINSDANNRVGEEVIITNYRNV